MARKASAKGSGTTARKSASRAGKKAGAKGTKSSASSGPARRSAKQESAKTDNAADALIGLIESPLVADLLAAAVTAAAATILEHKLKRKQESGSLVRAVGAATAAAVGRQLASEIEEIRKAAEEARAGKEG